MLAARAARATSTHPRPSSTICCERPLLFAARSPDTPSLCASGYSGYPPGVQPGTHVSVNMATPMAIDLFLPRVWRLPRDLALGRGYPNRGPRPPRAPLRAEVLEEVSRVFPDPLLHLGGEEVHWGCWASARLAGWAAAHAPNVRLCPARRLCRTTAAAPPLTSIALRPRVRGEQ